VRTVWISLGTGGIGCCDSSCKQRNAGGNSWRQNGTDERCGFYASGFDEVAEADKQQGTWNQASKGTI